MERVYVRKTQTGKRYDAIFNHKDPETGKRRQEKRTFKSQKEAREWLSEQTLAAKNGTQIIKKQTHTLTDVLELWLKSYKPNLREKTWEDYAKTINNHLIPGLGTIPVQKFTAVRLQEFYNQELERGVGLCTLRQCHLRLSQALRHAKSLGLVADLVTDHIKPPRYAPGSEQKTWTQTECQRFLSVAHQSWYGPIWSVLLLTGMRRGEALALTWDSINFGERSIHITKSSSPVRGGVVFNEPKTRAGNRTVYVSQELIEILQAHKLTQTKLCPIPDLVFTNKSGYRVHPDTLHRDFARLVKLAQVRYIRPHDLRHTWVSHALALGIPVKVVSELAGHASIRTTISVYQHTTREQHRDAGERIANSLATQGTRG